MKYLLVLVLSVFSFSAVASDGIKPVSSNAALIDNLLTSPKTSPEIKRLLGAVVDGQTYENRVSIIKIEDEGALGARVVSIQVGVDNTSDGDDGWSSVFEIRAFYQRNGKGDFYLLKKVEIETIAG